MKLIASRIWDHYLVPTLSTILFVTIITASPTPLAGKMNNEELQTIAVTQPAAQPQTAAPSNTTDTASVSDPAVPASAPAAPAPSTSVKKEQPKTTTSKTGSTQKATPSASTSPATPAKPTTQSKASSVIATAKQYIGVKYVYGGTTPSGFDCSGFVQYVFSKNGISLPRVSRDQYKTGTSVSFSSLQPGDLVFFSLAKNGIVDHVGIYVGNGQFINASSSKGVTIYTLGSYWQSAYLGARRVL
ncbi:cell wall-associated hydrolase, invasion-associated protein [Desulfosporosinus orientis DSM 765]|uniref:Cell wall-associated hydrolase, invasion-associated protein n=1 Tax=Desulfosporosinus orientis (strain ATCC 19365 / DSM 765 / NCIMB 8382 / VKM B-1628 / Singapore I) TaxID=768706 RepID=G7WAT9_DESOD|nr:cell wall-associated hydrolase, invasion-associated protein [Desulfosporosinus orientis DSM 765]